MNDKKQYIRNILILLFSLVLVLNVIACDDNFDEIISEEKVQKQPIDSEDFIFPGNDGIITIVKIESNSIDISWEKAIIVDKKSSGLFYEVYKSYRNNLSSSETIRKNGKFISSGDGITSAKITNLKPDTVYYVNVIVTLKSENIEILYRTAAVITEEKENPGSIYMFATEKVNGDFGGRNGADKLCSETKSNTYSHLPGKSIRAFISIDKYDYIAQMTSMYYIPEDSEILGPTDIIIADNWSDLLDGSIINSLTSANVSTETGWWSGSNSDGSYDDSVDNCKGWTSTRPKATAGSHDSDDGDWINLNSPNCSSSRHVLCVTW